LSPVLAACALRFFPRPLHPLPCSCPSASSSPGTGWRACAGRWWS